VELACACILVACEVATRMGWFPDDLEQVGPLWLRILLPCLPLFPIRPRDIAYWLDDVPWAVGIGLLLHDNALPRGLWIVRLILWSYLGARAAVVLWKRRERKTPVRA
jgi:hypothetical protein